MPCRPAKQLCVVRSGGGALSDVFVKFNVILAAKPHCRRKREWMMLRAGPGCTYCRLFRLTCAAWATLREAFISCKQTAIVA